MPNHMQEELQNSLNRLNNESDSNRIKLEALRGAYIQLAQAYHLMLCKVSSQDSFRTCLSLACKSNLNVLIKLELQ